jgi:hypothetical protein
MLVMADNKPPHNRPPDNRPPDRGQETSQTQTQEATAKSSSRASSESVSGAEASATGGSAHAQGGEGGAGGAGGAASATNDGVQNSTEINSRTENNSTNIVLVPNNNTENCLRVWGLSFGREGTAGGIGVPTRSAACDFEQAADDAAALGNHRLAWYWRCHKKNIYKPFKQNGEQKEVAIRQCYTEMWQLLAPEPDPTPVGYQLVSDDEYEELLMAQVQQEEIEQLEDRYAQQQSLIEEMQEEIAEHDSEQADIESLKREAASLRAAQEAEDKQQADIRAQFKARLARYEEGEDGDEDDGRED